MLLNTEHTLGYEGIGPRTFRDSFEIALFDYQVMADIVAERFADFDYVSDCFMDRYREAREAYVSVRAAYLGL